MVSSNSNGSTDEISAIHAVASLNDIDTGQVADSTNKDAPASSSGSLTMEWGNGEEERKERETNKRKSSKGSRPHGAPATAEAIPIRQRQKVEELQTKTDASAETGTEVAEDPLLNAKFRHRRQEKLKKLPMSRRLQETTIEELLLDSQVPVAQIAQQIQIQQSSSGIPLPSTGSVESSDSDSFDIEHPVRRSVRMDDLPPTISHNTSHLHGRENQEGKGAVTETSKKEKQRVAKIVAEGSTRESQKVASKMAGKSIREKRKVSKTIAERSMRESKEISRMMDEELSARRRRRVVQQFSGSLEASMLFQQSAQTNTFYLNRPEELPTVDPRGSGNSGMRVLESRLCIPKDQDMERALYALFPTLTDTNEKELEFIGQAWVSLTALILL